MAAAVHFQYSDHYRARATHPHVATLYIVQGGPKSKPQYSTHNFVQYWPISNILSLPQSPGNLQQSDH